MTKIGPGAPALIDLQTPDEDASAQFYSALFGWKIDAQNPSGYRYARTDNGAIIAGIRPAYGEAPPAWTLYLATDDIAGTAKDATEQGGSVLHGPLNVPGQGCVLIVADPSGAITGFWQSEPGYEFASDTPGTFAWAELLTADGKADDFYSALTGASVTQLGDGEHYDYTVWTPAGQQVPVVGRFRTDAPAGWRVYFAVDPDVGTDKAVETAAALGAATITEPNDIPAGRIAVLADPTGAEFALLTPTRRN